MSVTSLSRSRSRSRSISPTVVQESPLENPALTDSDSESVSVSILDSCGAELASGHVNVVATDGSASQSPANSPVLPIVVPTAVKSPPPQMPARSAFGLSSTACNAYSWAINRIAGNPPDLHAPFPFIGPNSMPGHITVIGNPMLAHPHARSTSQSVQVQLMSTTCECDRDVVDHFCRLISIRRSCYKPFYIGATTRMPLERFHLPTRPPHAEVYDGMVVGWVGNATDAKRIEPLIMAMAHHIFPYHCVNCRQTGGEGISAGSQNASLYMCYGGRNTLLMRRVGENWASRGRLSDVLH